MPLAVSTHELFWLFLEFNCSREGPIDEITHCPYCRGRGKHACYGAEYPVDDRKNSSNIAVLVLIRSAKDTVLTCQDHLGSPFRIP